MGILVSRCRRPNRWSCVVPLGARMHMAQGSANRISRCPDVIEAHEKYERGPMPLADVWTKIRPPPPPPPDLSQQSRKLPTQHRHPLDSMSARLSLEERKPPWSVHSRPALAPDVLLTIPPNNSCFGYDIRDVDAFLAEASLEKPANIPMVLCRAAPLFKWPEAMSNGPTPTSSPPPQLMLPLGMVVNGLFRHKSWLYAQTPHGHEGFIRYAASLPLGILPPSQSCSCSTPRSASGQPASQPCWESASDVFPQPRGYSQSAAGRIPQKTTSERGYSDTKRARTNGRSGSVEAERGLDKLYLRALHQRCVPSTQLRAIHHDFGFV